MAALEPLTANLGERPAPDGATPELIEEMLGAASSGIREAAGSLISQATSTIRVVGPESAWLRLPPGAVVSVDEVTLDGVEISDWRLLEGHLWRAEGWGGREPVEVAVTLTHGHLDVPEDIIALCRDLAMAGINTALEGEGSRAGLQSDQESIDDYSRARTYITGREATAGVMELPEATRKRLQARFGGGVYVTGASR